MDLKDDDALYSIDSIFLGPKRLTLPWQVRYVCYVIGTMILILGLVIEHSIGLTFSFQLFIWTLGCTIALTMLIGRQITYDKPARTVAATAVNELLAPRIKDKEPRPEAVRLRRIK